jgi:hypothetical protein
VGRSGLESTWQSQHLQRFAVAFGDKRILDVFPLSRSARQSRAMRERFALMLRLSLSSTLDEVPSVGGGLVGGEDSIRAHQGKRKRLK